MTAPETVLHNRYRIVRQIGRGGMGTVYLAIDQKFNAPVALKKNACEDDQSRRAFEREAIMLNRLRHPALPKVIDHFTEGQTQFLVMEFIAGDDLGTILQKRIDNIKPHGKPKLFAIGDVLKWADQLLDALDYLHTRQPPVIHRDIKPQNLKLAERDQIILLDFGLAKGSGMFASQAASSRSIYGYTPSYAPVEQIQGTGTDPRSDLYSLGATLYCLLAGHAPIDALTRATAVLEGNPDPLVSASESNPNVPVAVAQVLIQAMSLNRHQRPSSAAQMQEALRAAKINEQVTHISKPKAATRDIIPPLPLSEAQSGKSTDEDEPATRRAKVSAPESPPDGGARSVEKQDDAHSLALVEMPKLPSATLTINDVAIDMIKMPGGTFLMGSPESEAGRYADEGPQHEVTLSPFYIGKYEVTQSQWRAAASLPKVSRDLYPDPSQFKGDDRPVENVSWEEAVEFCARLSKATGQTYRLPTEAEWEYACRATTTGPYAGNIDSFAWHATNSGNKTHPVGTRAANVFGLHDMHGNVWEWCSDRCLESYYSQSASKDPKGPATGSYRVLRGGSWLNPAQHCRSANRHGFAPNHRSNDLGFRVVRSMPGPDKPSQNNLPAKISPLHSSEPFNNKRKTESAPSAQKAEAKPVINRSVWIDPKALKKRSSSNVIKGVAVIIGFIPVAILIFLVLKWGISWGIQKVESIINNRASEKRVNDLKVRMSSRMVKLEGGTFMMGPLNSEGGTGDGPQRKETVAPIYIGKYEVTQADWRAVAGLPKVSRDLYPDPSQFKGDDRPVENVSWEEAVEFCARLSKATGQTYRLPTEAEWEYACRATTTGPYAGSLDSMAWYAANSTNRTSPVGTKIANVFGLHDMHGNVWEWCQDSPPIRLDDGVRDLRIPGLTIFRSIRGGAWDEPAQSCRSASRNSFSVTYRGKSVGFRIVRTVN